MKRKWAPTVAGCTVFASVFITSTRPTDAVTTGVLVLAVLLGAVVFAIATALFGDRE